MWRQTYINSLQDTEYTESHLHSKKNAQVNKSSGITVINQINPDITYCLAPTGKCALNTVYTAQLKKKPLYHYESLPFSFWGDHKLSLWQYDTQWAQEVAIKGL